MVVLIDASIRESIGAHDLWLGAACLSRGLSLATVNAGEFSRVPRLEVEVWADS